MRHTVEKEQRTKIEHQWPDKMAWKGSILNDCNWSISHNCAVWVYSNSNPGESSLKLYSKLFTTFPRDCCWIFDERDTASEKSFSNTVHLFLGGKLCAGTRNRWCELSVNFFTATDGYLPPQPIHERIYICCGRTPVDFQCFFQYWLGTHSWRMIS